MPKLCSDSERQLALDFEAVQERVTEAFLHQCKVINFADHIRPAKSLLEPSPALERLLSEAKRLKW